MTWDSVKVAKLAVGNAHIGGVYIAVDNPSNLGVWLALPPHLMGYAH
jgi:hypothetical protein